MIKDYLDDVQQHRLFSGESPFRAYLTPGDSVSRAAVLAGPNASGKSLLVRLLASWLNDSKVEPLQVSMRYRTTSGIHRAFMFGSDEDQSTGATSLHAVNGALGSSRGREKPHWVFLDEPDIGLAEEYAGALGHHLAAYANDMPETAGGFVLVSHSRPLIQAFTESLVLRPHFMHMERPATLDSWLADRAPRSVAELLALETLGDQRFRGVEQIIRNARKAKAS